MTPADRSSCAKGIRPAATVSTMPSCDQPHHAVADTPDIVLRMVTGTEALDRLTLTPGRIPEDITDGGYGLLVSPADPAPLAAALTAVPHGERVTIGCRS